MRIHAPAKTPSALTKGIDSRRHSFRPTDRRPAGAVRSRQRSAPTGSRPSDCTLDNFPAWCHRAPKGVHVWFHHRCLYCDRLGVPNLYLEAGTP